MGLFKKKQNQTAIPVISQDECEPVLRCSICTGEQVLCAKPLHGGELQELMLIRFPGDLEAFCEKNGIDPGTVKKVY